MTDTLLDIADIETRYGLSQVLFGLSLRIAPGEMVTLMGRNGMGKTTTVRSIMGLTPAMAGSIRFDGEEISKLPAYRIGQRGIGLVPEGRQVFPNLSARENLVATAANRGDAANPWTLEKVCALFPRLAERITSMANLLSGGEQQMLAIGRALMTNPAFAHSRRSDGRARPAHSRRDLALPRAPQSRRPIDPVDRQECADADAHRRPPLPDRARARGVDRQFAGARGGTGRAAPVFGNLSAAFICSIFCLSHLLTEYVKYHIMTPYAAEA